MKIDEDKTVDLNQAEYNDASNDQIDGFSVIFEVTQEHALDQGVHQVEHSEAGKGEVFLVPVISEDPKKRKYELSVSKLKEGADDPEGNEEE